MITGAHAIVYSRKPEADREFLRDVLRLPHVDVGHGWLIFGLPPSEIAVHPAKKNDRHELYFLCEDVEAFVTSMSERGVACGPVQDMGWGRLTQLTLPGGGKIGIYEARHARPKNPRPRKAPAAPAKSAKAGAKKAAPKGKR
jgi:hypothetical protein